MDPFLARTMVESLSKGIDPLSGRALPLKDSCSNEEIQEALLEVLAHCSIESNEQYLVRLKEEKAATRRAKRNEYVKRYPRGGEPWQDEEEKQLLRMHRKGVSNLRSGNSADYFHVYLSNLAILHGNVRFLLNALPIRDK